MRKRLLVLASSLFNILFIVIVIGHIVIVAQTPITGEWKADSRSENQEKDGKIQLSFERSTEKGHQNQFGSGFAYEDLQGLKREQTQNGKVNFRVVREAGTIECIGAFTNGRGSGTFVFTPNQAFVSGMQSRGYNLSDEKQFVSATLDLTLAFVDDLKSTGFADLSLEDLFKARIFNITSKFVAEMKATGFPNLDMEDLVKARIFKIDADYVRQVKEMGFESKSIEGLVKLRIFKVTPEFLAVLKNEGFTNLSSEEVVKFRIFNIDREFIRKAKAEDPNVTVEDLVRMKIGVHRTAEKD